MKYKINSDDPAELIEKLESFNKELQFLHQISQKISEKKPLPQLLQEIMDNSKLLLKAEASSLLLFNQTDRKLHFYIATGEKGELLEKFIMELGEGIAGWTAEHQKSLIIKDCYKDSRFNPEYDKKFDFKTKSMICVPMVRNKELLGVIEVINKRGEKTFDSEDLFLLETLASQCAIAIENHRLTQKQIEAEVLEQELETAREIQQNILPKSTPHYDDLDVASFIIPAKQIGGDYYNIIRINDDQSLFFIADVSGKSISAALIVSIVDACLNSYLKITHEKFNLMGLVKTMNQILIQSTTTTKFTTCWFGLYHHASAELVSVNAGHNPPYLFQIKQDKNITLEKGGLFLGCIDSSYEFDKIIFQENNILVYYTDGVTEAWNADEEDYGEKRLIQTVLNNKQGSAQEILSAIKQDIYKHVKDAQQSDDIACVVIKKLNF